MSRNRIWVEAWDPEYGSSYEVASGLAPTEEEVAVSVERDPGQWEPITPTEPEWHPMAFVDGVGRVDARAFLDAEGETVPGMCCSVGVGVVTADGPAAFGSWEVQRAVIFGSGAAGELPPITPSLSYRSRSVAGSAPEELIQGLDDMRTDLEVEFTRSLTQDGRVVVADGPLRIREPLPIVGFIKSHRKAYLPPDLEPVVRGLQGGQRTPVFMFGVIRPRYSWYLRLATPDGGHPWAAVARCEVSAALSEPQALALADFTTHHLPRFASKGYWDSRAPQNLVPIASLERRLWHLLGDRQLVYRRIRSALMRPEVAA